VIARTYPRASVVLFAAALVSAAALPLQAQHEGHQMPPAETGATAWTWTVDANAFFGFNKQDRKFRDFSAWESQNWVMLSGARGVGGGVFRATTMLSFEPFTIPDLGSPQVFQTGETFQNAPLIDYQHPHDLFMGIGTDYRRAAGRITLLAGLDVVGSPSFGPPVFMHRPSAAENPQVPLSHHHMDSTHITPGVLRGGIEAGAFRVEASWFRGREPDENRTDLDLGALDSAAGRLSWNHGGWSAQVSAAHLKQPERLSPYDSNQCSASFGYTRGDDSRRFAWLAAFGQKREIHGTFDAYLLEATLNLTRPDALYVRGEIVDKDILDAGFHPNFVHLHRQSRVGALTIGYVRDLLRTRIGRVGAGLDATGYIVPANLEENYGSPRSYHFFLRYRAR
jgi:hypothetical protein